SGLPAYNSGKTYQSEVIESAESYKYLRFTVTKSHGPGNTQYGGQYFFGMVEFDLKIVEPETYTANLTENVSGVTEDLLIAAHKENEEAKAVKTYATTESQVAEALAQLQEKYDALKDATYLALNVNNYGYATLYLPYATAIPANAKAYIVTEANNQGWATLKEVEGNVLPANTGVVIEATEGEYQFAYSTESTADIEGNLLEGSTTTGKKTIESGYKYYVLGATDNQVGLYLAQKYDANGNAVAANSNDATQFQVTANKAYLPVNGAAAAYYTFKLNGATGIDTAVSTPAIQSIYDLNGQRVSTIVRSGIYIVNGQKCFIQVK
ncbi:MAG: hypothetical protein J6R79_01420, partial [Bacteroidaceae bacterium]|nr:hypothetical protein [Bacteroidaceae bacterium]